MKDCDCRHKLIVQTAYYTTHNFQLNVPRKRTHSKLRDYLGEATDKKRIEYFYQWSKTFKEQNKVERILLASQMSYPIVLTKIYRTDRAKEQGEHIAET